MTNQRRLLALLGGCALLLALGSCDDDDATSPGTQPLVSEIQATPAIVDQGGQVSLQVTASGDGLAYLWTATGGTFSAPTSPLTLWTAPNAPGVHMVTVTVINDRNLSTSRSVAVGVEIGLELQAQSTTVVIANRTRIAARAVGQNLTYTWQASLGTLRQIASDTVEWRAPDTVPPQNPTVRAVAVDAAGNARAATIALTVTHYVPTDSPVYKGAAYCGFCHVGTHQAWSATGHARAYETLAAIGVQDNPYCLQCHTVGSKGVGADPALNNGAYNDIPIAALRGVQCENCHGPGSEHPGAAAGLPASLDAADCGTCHNGAHHPTYDEWASSAHGDSRDLSGATRAACVKCHNGAYAASYLDNPGAFVNPAAVTATEDITCAVCHDPHGNDNRANLRNAAASDIVLPDGSVIPEAGAGRLCMACHNGRRTPTNILDQINNGSAQFGPHHSNQGDMLAGTGAYEGINPAFAWGSSTHLAIQDGCVNCHTHAHEGTPAYTGHTFLPTVEACRPCHGGVTSFEQVAAFGDWDGDGAIEGVQLEIDGLIAMLRQAIIDASASPESRALLEGDFEANLGQASVTTADQRKAGYNLRFVQYDHSRGVHNARYAVQLLQQSILFLQPGKLAADKLLLD